jgi:hypothetical protein
LFFQGSGFLAKSHFEPYPFPYQVDFLDEEAIMLERLGWREMIHLELRQEALGIEIPVGCGGGIGTPMPGKIRCT